MKRTLVEVTCGLAALVVMVSFHRQISRLEGQAKDVQQMREQVDAAVATVTERAAEGKRDEGELAVVIGRPCRDVAAEDALAAVAGATILNDLTARDLPFNGTQWLPGKALDGATPCGPALVTLDEVGDLQVLDLATRVNGREVQRSSTARMIFPVAAVVAYISRFLELRPGDVITTGTPEGIGSRRDPPSFLAPGDVVEVEIEHLGVLRNVVR